MLKTDAMPRQEALAAVIGATHLQTRAAIQAGQRTAAHAQAAYHAQGTSSAQL